MRTKRKLRTDTFCKRWFECWSSKWFSQLCQLFWLKRLQLSQSAAQKLWLCWSNFEPCHRKPISPAYLCIVWGHLNSSSIYCILLERYLVDCLPNYFAIFTDEETELESSSKYSIHRWNSILSLRFMDSSISILDHSAWIVRNECSFRVQLAPLQLSRGWSFWDRSLIWPSVSTFSI